jgi:hypothetical protein
MIPGGDDQLDGEFFESIQVRSPDRAQVMDALARAQRSMGFVPVAPDSLPPYEGPIEEETETGARRFFVGPALDGWVSILPSADLPEQLATAQHISEELHQPAVVLNLHNGDVFYYWVFRNGDLVDQYDSNPDYFGEPRSPEELEAIRGHPARWAELIPPGTEPRDVEAILTQTFAADEQNEQGSDQLVLWGDEQFDDFTKLLGIRNAAHSYEDASLEGLEGFVEHPEQFTEVAFAPPLGR